MDGVVEIITGRERRRRWSLQDKLRLVAETHEPGAAVGAVAARHDVCESLLYAWRRQVRGGVLTAAPEMSVFCRFTWLIRFRWQHLRLPQQCRVQHRPMAPPPHLVLLRSTWATGSTFVSTAT